MPPTSRYAACADEGDGHGQQVENGKPRRGLPHRDLPGSLGRFNSSGTTATLAILLGFNADIRVSPSVTKNDLPRPAAYLAVLRVHLLASSPGVESDLHAFATIRTDDPCLGVRNVGHHASTPITKSRCGRIRCWRGQHIDRVISESSPHAATTATRRHATNTSLAACC